MTTSSFRDAWIAYRDTVDAAFERSLHLSVTDVTNERNSEVEDVAEDLALGNIDRDEFVRAMTTIYSDARDALAELIADNEERD